MTGQEHMSLVGRTDRVGIRSGLCLPLFDELADPVVPVNLDHPDQLAEMVVVVAEHREDATAPYDPAVGLPLGTDPLSYADAGATWWMPDLVPGTLSRDQVRGVVRDGPAPAS